jgi:hypothetical protein
VWRHVTRQILLPFISSASECIHGYCWRLVSGTHTRMKNGVTITCDANRVNVCQRWEEHVCLWKVLQQQRGQSDLRFFFFSVFALHKNVRALPSLFDHHNFKRTSKAKLLKRPRCWLFFLHNHSTPFIIQPAKKKMFGPHINAFFLSPRGPLFCRSHSSRQRASVSLMVVLLTVLVLLECVTLHCFSNPAPVFSTSKPVPVDDSSSAAAGWSHLCAF